VTPERQTRRGWRPRTPARSGTVRVVPHFLVALVVSVVAAGCGQYYGVHQGSADRNRVQLSSAHGHTSPPPFAGDDGAEGPGPGAISGDASLVMKRQIVAPSGPSGGSPRAKRTGSKRGGTSTTTSGNSRTEGSGAKGSKPGRQPLPSVPKSIQSVLRQGANYNSRFLPQGFPFLICPVQGRYTYSDDYGAPRYAGGYHPHAGNDIFAGQGTPIVAPFSGDVAKTPNSLGGNAVKVSGSLGYVYMAHLVAYAPSVPGPVEAGDVVGFVGNTGDAQGTSYHDHFEWHPAVARPYDKVIPGTNGAVDPFQYLRVVCPPG
jgi:murein DD-endopeptidase MepM/ murein hydrolase activator NlpD